MARGDDNILFNPLRIKKPAANDPRGHRRGHFPEKVHSLFLTDKRIVTRSQTGAISFFDDKMREAGLRDVIFSEISDGGLLVASSEGIAFGDHEGFIAYDNDGIQKSAFPSPPGRLLGLHLTSSYAIALHHEEGGEITLSTLYLLGDPEWEEWKSYSEGSEIEFFNKGDNSFIAYKEPGDEKLQLFGLTPYGIGVRSLSLDPGTFKSTPETHLITPAGDNQYFALEHGRYGDEITLIQEGDSREAERQRVQSFIGRDKTTWRDIIAHGDRGAILGEGLLTIFRKGEVPEEIPLEPEDGYFNRVSLGSDRAILWREDSSAYLLIPLGEVS